MACILRPVSHLIRILIRIHIVKVVVLLLLFFHQNVPIAGNIYLVRIDFGAQVGKDFAIEVSHIDQVVDVQALPLV